MTKQYSFSLLPLFVTAVLALNTLPAVGQEVCGEFGTSVVFANSPAEAARLAVKHEKLVFVLHVSGLFEEPDFT